MSAKEIRFGGKQFLKQELITLALLAILLAWHALRHDNMVLVIAFYGFVFVLVTAITYFRRPKGDALSEGTRARGLTLAGTYRGAMTILLVIALGSASFPFMFLFKHHDFGKQLQALLLLFNIPLPWVLTVLGGCALKEKINRLDLSPDSQQAILRASVGFSIFLLTSVYVTIFVVTRDIFFH
jgi:hypothetical protein